MALFPFCKSSTGLHFRVNRLQLLLYCLILSVIIYFLHGRKATVVAPPHHIFHAQASGQEMTDMAGANVAQAQISLKTPWGAPIVWGDTQTAAWRRAKFAQREVHTGLIALVVGTYAHFLEGFLSSAETHFLPGQTVTYYILTDNPRILDPPKKLRPKRELKVVPIAELPGWDRLYLRRMALLADVIKDTIGNKADYVFCADIDQEFVAPVGEEIFGDLVATLHPELYGRPRRGFPYEEEDDSSACVQEDEGDYYYTSELYGGLVSEVFKLARACSLLILKDQANGVTARGQEESYLNRYLINHRPTCVLSPEYNWWDSILAVEVPVQRLVSVGRQCETFDSQKREQHRC